MRYLIVSSSKVQSLSLCRYIYYGYLSYNILKVITFSGRAINIRYGFQGAVSRVRSLGYDLKGTVFRVRSRGCGLEGTVSRVRSLGYGLEGTVSRV